MKIMKYRRVDKNAIKSFKTGHQGILFSTYYLYPNVLKISWSPLSDFQLLYMYIKVEILELT